MSDLIDRQVAIDAIDRVRKEKHLFNTAEDGLLEARGVINTLPSAQPEHTSNNDCNGCKFVGCYDTSFPCANCIRKNKDYYAPERRTDD